MERVLHGNWPRRASLGFAAASLLVIVGLYLLHLRGRSSVSSARAAVPEAAYTLAPEEVGKAADRVVESASSGWVAAGIAQDQAERLGSAARDVLASIWMHDYEHYDRFARSRGAVLDAGAASLAQTYRGYGYRAVPDSEWGATAEEHFRYMWAHPEGRGAGWRKIGAARGGTGWYLSTEDSHKGTSGQISLLAPPNLMSLISKSQSGGVASAWIQMPVMFENGCTCEVRLTFLLNPDDHQWIPVRIESIGGPCSAALIL